MRLRAGELLALGGTVCIAVALGLSWYQTPTGNVDAWATFGLAVALLLLAALAGLSLAVATLAERSTAVPVAAAVWCTLFGLLGCIGGLVRLLERPDHASSLCAGPWLGFAGAILVLAGGWQSLRDERIGRYDSPEIEPRQAPP